MSAQEKKRHKSRSSDSGSNPFHVRLPEINNCKKTKHAANQFNQSDKNKKESVFKKSQGGSQNCKRGIFAFLGLGLKSRIGSRRGIIPTPFLRSGAASRRMDNCLLS